MKKEYLSPYSTEITLLTDDFMRVSSPGVTPPDPAPRRTSPAELLE